MKLDEIMAQLLEGKPSVAGRPGERVLEMPMDVPIVATGNPAIPAEEYDSVLEADASFLPQEKIQGEAWSLTVQGRRYAIRSRGRRFGKGPNAAELRAIIDGMTEAEARSCERLLIKTDSRWCAHVLTGLWKAKRDYTASLAERAHEIMKSFSEVAVVHTRTRNLRAVDRAARRAADSKAVEGQRAEEKRIDRVRATLAKAQSVTLVPTQWGWRANGFFEVRLNPPSCTCKDWLLRWAYVPLPGKRAQRLPCKHIAAAAKQQGITDPRELLQLCRRALA